MAKERHPKRAKGILKMAAFLAPMVLGLGGIFSALGTGIAFKVKNERLMEDYQQSAIYEQQYNYDKDEANRAYEAGEIKHLEYDKRIEHIGTDEYVEEVMNMDLEGNEEYQAKLKEYKKLEVGLFTTLGIGAAGLGGLVTLLLIDHDKQWARIMDDIQYTSYIDTPKKQPKQIEEESEDEDETLPRIEDSCYKE